MNFEPFDTGLVITRLRDQVKTAREIAGAAEYAAIKDLRGFQTPALYVIFAREGGNAQGPRGARVQPAQTSFGVVMAARNYRPGAGGQLDPELRQLIGLVRSALIGWVPPAPGATAIAWTGGDVLDYDDSTVLYADSYQLTNLLQK